MITEDYVSFETAKLLKEKGFDVFGDGSYGTETRVFMEYSPVGKIRDISTCRPSRKGYPAPTLQMAMKWLREECNIFISIVFCTYPTEKRVTWTPEISTFDSVFPESAIEYDSYEQACEAAINYCLKDLI